MGGPASLSGPASGVWRWGLLDAHKVLPLSRAGAAVLGLRFSRWAACSGSFVGGWRRYLLAFFCFLVSSPGASFVVGVYLSGSAPAGPGGGVCSLRFVPVGVYGDVYFSCFGFGGGAG